MRWVIDGYNVIRRDPDLRAREAESLEAGRRALMHLVAGLARQGADEFTIVFDGARRGAAPAAPGRVRVVFSRPPESADDVVIRLAGQWREGAVVVTSDRVIQHAAIRARCAVVAADEFLAHATRRPAAAAAEKDDEEDDERAAPKRGNPRQPSKKARAAARALRRLRPG
jgi:predicted RNA-binding protein with PIN domain